jgi:hypothetical protein
MGCWWIRHLFRRMAPGLLSSMALWSWLGPVVLALPALPDDETDDEIGHGPDDGPDDRDLEAAVGPPPGHPERYAGHLPMTPEEHALWSDLEGTGR